MITNKRVWYINIVIFVASSQSSDLLFDGFVTAPTLNQLTLEMYAFTPTERLYSSRRFHTRAPAHLYTCTPVHQYTSTCTMNMKYFPFDEQNCSFQFSSWSYGDNQLTLDFVGNSSDINLAYYVTSSDWDLLSSGANRIWIDTDGTYYQLIYYVTLKRRAGFYLYVLIVPSLLLSVLTPGLFWIPPSRPDRTVLGRNPVIYFFYMVATLGVNNICRMCVSGERYHCNMRSSWR